jgi:hypothetical protein
LRRRRSLDRELKGVTAIHPLWTTNIVVGPFTARSVCAARFDRSSVQVISRGK